MRKARVEKKWAQLRRETSTDEDEDIPVSKLKKRFNPHGDQRVKEGQAERENRGLPEVAQQDLLEHRDVDLLPSPGLAPAMERREQTHHCETAGADVADRAGHADVGLRAPTALRLNLHRVPGFRKIQHSSW